MAENTLIQGIGEWLVDQALSEPDIIEMFNDVCHRLYGAGVPVARARVSWSTLHPLFQAETALWERGSAPKLEQFRHQNDRTEEYYKSPMHFMFENQVNVLRRNLDGPNKLIDFPILEELVEQGLTDYLTIATEFISTSNSDDGKQYGLIVAWSSDRPGGFSDQDIAALQKIQRRFAVACKAAIQSRIASNIVETYLGKNAGKQVLDGAIKRGDGYDTQAVVWYSDLRNSTALADTMVPDDYFALLNEYFECTAASVIQKGGEVLDFIGDGVLAIFPYSDEDAFKKATCAATKALRQALQMTTQLNVARKKNGQVAIQFGVALNAGKVMFGNIGVEERLSFSVIGPTVNEVSRIEAMTKAVEANALVTPEIASIEPEQWVSTGVHRLVGVSQEIELFAPITPEQVVAVESKNIEKETSPRLMN